MRSKAFLPEPVKNREIGRIRSSKTRGEVLIVLQAIEHLCFAPRLHFPNKYLLLRIKPALETL